MATNPCPCGYHGDPLKDCRCSDQRVANYRQKISGPLLDRIDMHLSVPRVQVNVLAKTIHAESSSDVLQRVLMVRERQAKRGGLNATLAVADIAEYLEPDDEGCELLERASRERQLSGRGQHKVLRLARTIADLAGCERVAAVHVGEALQLREH